MGNTASDQWEGPPDAYTSAQDTNNKRSKLRQSVVSSIHIAKYWDVYSPPPKDSTKAKIGTTLTFLVDFGRQRRISLESHQIKLTPPPTTTTTTNIISDDDDQDDDNILEVNRYLRISKQQDDQSYKTKYLIDVANFEIVSVDDQRKEIIYKSYDNGEEYEGSFIFENYT